MCLITAELVHTLIKPRDRELHKGNCGKVLVIAGSKGMMGAAILAARGALRSGAGLVRMALPEELYAVAQVAVPEATCVSRQFTEEELNGYDAIAMGPGLGTGAESVALVAFVLQNYKGKLVLDADALTILAAMGEDGAAAVRKMTASEEGLQLVLTPHPGEAARLLACTTKDIQGDRAAAAQAMAEKYGAAAVLKGAGTRVTVPGGKAYTNTTGNPGMATGGSGDVLAGVTASLLAQGLAAEEAAVAAVYLHGLAGDTMAAVMGEYGLIAGDIAEGVALAIKSVLDTSSF